jgi:DNA-binding MarR family transcriptional regulator
MIKPNKFVFNVGAGNQVQELRYNLLHSCSWLTNGTRKLLKPHGITPKQFSILRNLEKKSPESSSIQEVRDSLADKMSDASRLIDRLVKKGYLDKFPSDFDRRSNRVRISDSGLEILKEINSRKEDLDGIVNDLLSDKEIKELNRLLSLLK